MSIYRSYFSKSNTITSDSYTNTARNPIVELFYGRVDNILLPLGFTRYIFDIDLSGLTELYDEKVVSTDCGGEIKHVLNMTNTSSFDKELLNDKTSQGRRRATSFDLVLFRIPKTSGSTGSPQLWDSGVGYDYYDVGAKYETDKSFSQRPSNWFQRTTVKSWSEPGLYDNTNSKNISGLNFSGLTIIGTQHFEFGDEDISIDMTNEINGIIDGSITGVTGWGIAFYPDVENITGMTENYSVGFFSPYTQTFFEPFLETTYDDLILDNRNAFYANTDNSLYLYSYVNGNPINFDSNPTVDVLDSAGDPVDGFTSLPTCLVTKGVYKVDIDGLSANTIPCLFYDVWNNITVNGNNIPSIENEFVVSNNSGYYQIGTTTQRPKLYGFDFDGIKQNEKILNTDVRKVNVTIKQAYSTNTPLNNVEAYYRIYVREGKTEVQVQDWTRINQTPDNFYFIFDTRDKIPNEYFIDIKVNSDRNVDTYKRELQFQIVNKK
jgi:hypothetical protein